MVNITFNQHQKTLHLSYHTCMYLKVDISIVGLGSVRLMSLLNYTCSYIYNGLPADKNVCKSHCFIDPDSSIHSFFYSFINSILKLFCFYSFITFIILHLHRKPSLFQLAACLHWNFQRPPRFRGWTFQGPPLDMFKTSLHSVYMHIKHIYF